MANSKFEYTKSFEQTHTVLPNTYIVIRVDGRAFHQLSDKYAFEKPNDRRALDLMNVSATATMAEIPDIRISYGVSDEYSFLLSRSTQLFARRESKILTTVVSTFTAHYVHRWADHFPDTPLSPPLPSFDGRVVAYPSLQNLRDYFSWRQADCHINNLYNTTFWAMVVRGGVDRTEAEIQLKGTSSSDKNEILFTKFGINYNKEPTMFRKGTVNFRRRPKAHTTQPVSERVEMSDISSTNRKSDTSKKAKHSERISSVDSAHCDLIQDEFWNANKHLT